MPNFRKRRSRYLEGYFPRKLLNIAACKLLNIAACNWANIVDFSTLLEPKWNFDFFDGFVVW